MKTDQRRAFGRELEARPAPGAAHAVNVDSGEGAVGRSTSATSPDPSVGASTGDRAQHVLVVVAVITFLALAGAAYACTLDDAFISFRYAENLAHGQGLVFNPGERVEGFSNPLWVFVLALASFLRLDVLTTAKVLGLACGAATLPLLDRICDRTLGLPRWARVAAMFYLATNIGFVYYAISGMETLFFGLLIVLMSFLISERRYDGATCLCALVVLTRPEGVLFAALLGVFALFETRSPVLSLRLLAIPTLTFALYMVFRISYYGVLLPNTHASKVVEPPSLSLDSIVTHTRALFWYTVRETSVSAVMLLLFVVGACALASRRAAPLLTSIACATFFVWYAMRDWMSFGRLYVPVLPLVVAFAFGALHLVARGVGRSRQRALGVSASSLLIVSTAMHTVGDIRRLNGGEAFNPAMHSRPHVALGRYLATHSAPDDVVVVNEIGAIAYYSGLRTVDMLGLTDRNIPGLLFGDNLDAYADYLLAQRPTYIMLNDKQNASDTRMRPHHEAIYKKMLTSGLYRAGAVIPLNRYKNLMVFVRNDARGAGLPP